MTTLTHSNAITAPGTTYRRDLGIDVIRALCLVVVVLLHAGMVGFTRDAQGAPVTSVALVDLWWFAPLSWVAQVMPLFFIAGGFAALTQWRRQAAGGASAASWIVTRTTRLGRPAALMFGAVGAVLWITSLAGAPAALLGEAAYRIAQPMWFLTVYLGVTALVPLMARCHTRRPRTTLLVLGALTLGIDLLARTVAAPIGFANLLFVWVLMQQLGFFLVESTHASPMPQHPRTARCRVALRIAGITLPLTACLLLVACGWSPDMIANLNPPTTMIALLGLAQFTALRLLRRRLNRWVQRPGIARFTRTATQLSMPVYLWHMPAILTLAALLWRLGAPLPEPHSLTWWLTRLPWLASALVCAVIGARLSLTLDQAVTRWQHLLPAVPDLRARPFLPGSRALTRSPISTPQRTLPALPITLAALLIAITASCLVLLASQHQPVSYLAASALLGCALLLMRGEPRHAAEHTAHNARRLTRRGAS